MTTIKQSLRSALANKGQSLMLAFLIFLGVFVYSVSKLNNDVMYESITAYDKAQNTEDYGFLPWLRLSPEQWDDIFVKYGVSADEQVRFKQGALDGMSLIRDYQVDLYAYQNGFIRSVEKEYGLVVEPSFNKMISNSANGHQYQVFSHVGAINQPNILEGAFPAGDGEVTISPEYAKYNNLNVGDALDINGKSFRISALAYHPANNYPVVVPSTVKESAIYYPEKQTVVFATAGALADMQGLAYYYYKAKNTGELSVAERNIVYHRLYNTNAFEVLDNALDSITHGETYVRIDSSSFLSAALAAILAGAGMFVVVLVIKRRIEADRRQIGVLKALGYGSWEIALRYCHFAALCSLVGGLAGYAAGQLLYPLMIQVGYADYNMPILSLPIDYTLMIGCVLVPALILVGASLAAAHHYVRKDPLDLIAGDREKEVNFLGRYVTKLLGGAKFETRTKYQLAVRSLTKLAAMLAISGCAGGLLLMGLLLQPAFTAAIDKTFRGINCEQVVEFKDNRNIATESPQYADENIVLGKDMFVQEVRYANGNVLRLDDTNKIMTETLGLDADNVYVGLVDAGGKNLNSLLRDGIVVNQKLQGRYNLNVGDALLLHSPHADTLASFPIVGIADQYCGDLVYTDREKMNEAFRYPEGDYNAVMTNHEYGLSDPGVKKILPVASFKAGMTDNLKTMQYLATAVMVISILVAFAVIYVAANLVVEENARAISTFKVLGYTTREIANLVVNVYTPVVVLGYLLATPVTLWLLGVLKGFLESKFETPMLVALNVPSYALGLGAILLVYLACIILSRRQVEQVAPAAALKMHE